MEIDVRKDEYKSSDGMVSDFRSEEGGRKIVESGIGKSDEINARVDTA